MTKTLKAAFILAVAAGAGCKTDGLNGSLPILAVIPPKATGGAVLSCSFETGAGELTEPPYNPAENIGSVGLLVENNLLDNSTISPQFRLNTATYQPYTA